MNEPMVSTTPSRLRHAAAGCALAACALLTLATPAPAALIFDDPSSNNQSDRSAGSSPLSHITVSQAVTIDQIAVLVDLDADGDLKFVVYNGSSASFDLITTAKAFVDDGATFKLSDVFTATVLSPGTDYYIGAIANVGGLWNYLSPSSPVTQNGITNLDFNGNVSNFAIPQFAGTAFAQIPIRLYGPGAAAVPEPSTIALAAGLAAVLGLHAALRRRAPARG